MELYLKLIDVLFPVFFIIGIGYYLGRKNPNINTDFITNFAGNIGTPGMIFYTITTTGVTLSIFTEYFVYALVIIIGFSLIGILFLLFILLPKTELTILLFASLLGVLWLSTVPLTSGIITVIFGPYYMSMLFGIVFFSHQIGSFLGSWLGGMFFDNYGSYDIMWWSCVILGFLSTFIHIFIKEVPVSRILNKKFN